MVQQLFSKAALSRQKWSELINPVLQRAWRADKEGRFPHALLLTGPEGMGRELAALEICAMLVCGGKPWSATPESRRLRSGAHPDFQIVAGEGKKDIIRIKTIREIVSAVPGRPFEGKRRVWLLDRVEQRLEPSAANALLKVLEEPPAHVVFILLADNPQALLPTIRSRCFRLSLPGVVGIAASESGEGTFPPELFHRLRGKKKAGELVEEIRLLLPEVLGGDTAKAFQLAGILGKQEYGTETCAAVAMEMAAQDKMGAEQLILLAMELLKVQPKIRVFSLNSERQLLSIFLKMARGV